MRGVKIWKLLCERSYVRNPQLQDDGDPLWSRITMAGKKESCQRDRRCSKPATTLQKTCSPKDRQLWIFDGTFPCNSTRAVRGKCLSWAFSHTPLLSKPVTVWHPFPHQGCQNWCYHPALHNSREPLHASRVFQPDGNPLMNFSAKT